MNRDEIVLKAFLVEVPSTQRAPLLSHLPKERKEALSTLPDISLETPLSPPSPFDEIHWSWYAEGIKTYPENDQRILLKALNPSLQTPLSRNIERSPIHDSLSPLGARFLRNALADSVSQDVFPVELLPPSPFNRLLQIEKKRLTELIDFLSLYDLFSETRQIVDTKTLNKIYGCLTKEERNFLKVASYHKEPYNPVQIDLDSWDGSRESLRKKLHLIGLARLGSALSGESPDLLWHLCHKLDSGRGKSLEKLSKKKQMPGVAKWLAEQLKEFL